MLCTSMAMCCLKPGTGVPEAGQRELGNKGRSCAADKDDNDHMQRLVRRVRSWPKCEVLTGAGNVCCRGQTRHTAGITKPTRLTQS
jgi:hypothetical protein